MARGQVSYSYSIEFRNVLVMVVVLHHKNEIKLFGVTNASYAET